MLSSFVHDFSIQAYRTLSMSLSYLASFMASVVARAFLDLGGRNLYAALQLVMVTLSTIIATCRKQQSANKNKI